MFSYYYGDTMAYSRVWVRRLFLFLEDLLKNGWKASKIWCEPGTDLEELLHYMTIDKSEFGGGIWLYYK